MAASLLVLRRSEIRGAVFSAGIYDFRRGHDETRVARMRENMEREAGMTPAAIEERTSIREPSLSHPLDLQRGSSRAR